MEVGDIYVHYRNTQEYMILGFPAFQDNTGRWVHDAMVLYRDKQGNLFIRPKVEFEKRFIKKAIV